MIDAYRQTRFEVSGALGGFVLRLDEPCPELLALHRERGVASSSYVTAWNPRSEPTPVDANARAHRRLIEWLCTNRFVCYEGWGRDPAGVRAERHRVRGRRCGTAAGDVDRVVDRARPEMAAGHHWLRDGR